ncbi:hypothetical protein CFE70_008385 [Pyrenophora teres f. teres 0-1]|uniref:Uncharacterized protein n=2 Tax=Pyrenophora teres f. teres TaxID=97479 RepID=E3RTF6_PYRTT|nr:hypothetical protein PTT_12274 [Pyrenophora teres f. teres 0-1]KAE8829098.1 hypothetical protein PTNB85_08286 [Pyrenophora teres f. teres]KAE8830258.1 hypothetical protein HRS9139_06882 [Pyrenophora teres f. teres]KAE8841400.1 hypothetical protein HRS9122_05526 [Pyrenophora teres f. teres]KAE8859503.1 hypothetical protein PTNB29_06734 [Pyrenophora teres f. teres]
MPKGANTGTKHHCPGQGGWVGEWSPGGCDVQTVETKMGKLSYCKKHSMPCCNGCKYWFHLKNQEGCQSCLSRWRAEVKQNQKAREAQKASEKQKVDAEFWNPGKDRKKPKKP